MLKSPQVCSQWRSLQGATAPDMFSTLRLSPVLIISPLLGGAQARKSWKEIFWLQLGPCDGEQSILKDCECKLHLWPKWTHLLSFSVTQQWRVVPNICLMAILLANMNSNTTVAFTRASARSINKVHAVPVLTVLVWCERPAPKGRRLSAKQRVN